MKRNKNLNSIGMLVILLSCGSQAASNRAAAAETPGAAVLDVCQLSLLPDDLDAKEIIGVYGEVRFLNPTTLIISNYRHPHYATEVDIRKMDRGDSARLATDCARSGCPQIVTGAFIQGRLHATRSYRYKNDFGMSSSCPAPARESNIARYRT